MMKKRLLVTFVISIAACSVLLFALAINAKENRRNRLADENKALQEISQRTGQRFDDWLALRTYLYCDGLKEGMTRVEVMELLSRIDKTRVSGNTVDFTNSYIDYYLGPVNLNFTSSDPSGRLKGWSGSTEINLGSPRAHCEK